LVRNTVLVTAAVIGLGVAAVVGLRDRDTEIPAGEITPVTAEPEFPTQPDPTVPPAPAGKTQEAKAAAKETPSPPAPAPPEPAPPEPAPPEPAPTVAEAPAEPKRPPAPKVTAAVPGRPPEPVSFRLTTNPPGAKAVFDNDPSVACTSPCTVNLMPGRHSVALAREGYRQTQRIIEVPRDPGIIVDLVAMSGTLSVVTNPAGLTVFINGKEQPRKTPLSVTLPTGEHLVQVVKGSERQEFTVQIRDGTLSSRSVEWP
jgi:hypothetical protein